MKRTISILVTLTLVFAILAGCGGGNNTETETNDGAANENTDANTAQDGGDEGAGTADGVSYTFGYACHDLAQTFQTTIHDRVQAQLEADGHRLITTDSARDTDLQISQIEDLIAQNVDVIVMSPSDKEGMYPALLVCEENGIPVVNYDSGVTDQELIAGWISSNHYNLGHLMGEYVLENYPEGGKWAVFRNATSQSLIERAQGFTDALADHPEFEILDQIVVNSDILGLSEDVLQANPDLTGIFSTMEAYTLTILSNIESAGRTGDIIVTSVDGAPSDKMAISEGTLAATSAQSPFTIADTIVEYFYLLAAGEDVPAHDVSIEPWIIDASNVGEYDLDLWQ